MQVLNNKQEEKYIFAFVGLPARGKSYLSRKLANFLNWIGYYSKVFSFGLYRRILIGVNCDSKFFQDANDESAKLRDKCYSQALDDMIDFLTSKGGKVGILDGANTSKDRRRVIEEHFRINMPSYVKYNILWIESITTIEKVIEENILKNKLKSPDYQGWNEDEALKDFRDRIKTYEYTYDNLSEEHDGKDCSFIQMKNFNSEVVIQNVQGFLQSKILSFMMNLYSGEKPIYFTRHGESENNVKNIIGGDPDLTEKGRQYTKMLQEFLSNDKYLKENKYSNKCIIYTSTLKRCIKTAEAIKEIGDHLKYKCLDDINLGEYDNISIEEFKEKHLKEYEESENDKLFYRYPRGESYMDLIHRIEPFIYEIERSEGPVIIIGSQSTLRCLYGYITNTPLKDIPYIQFPIHTIIRKLPQAYGSNEERLYFDVESNKVTKLDETSINYEDSLYNYPMKNEFTLNENNN
jgi:broad specificity phosphatase PhoE